MILASTSPYKKAQLESLGFSFQSINPKLNEEKVQKDPSLTPLEKAEKLSYLKALAVQKKYPQEIIISGDQLTCFQGKVLTKPGSKEKNIQQLHEMSGKVHELITSNSVFIPGRELVTHTEIAIMHFKPLNLEEITSYVERDQAWDCAGGYKFELNGANLFSKVEVKDPSSIQGMCLEFLKEYLSTMV